MKGSAIVKAVMAEQQIEEADFFRSKCPQHVDARHVAIKRLAAAGLNKSEIGRVMRRDETTIGYWLRPEMRSRKLMAAARNTAGASA